MTAPEPNLPEGAPALEVIGYSKRFGSFAALDDVSMKVRSGSFHVLLGENGAGKSTLVKCIMGYYKPDAGQIMINNREVEIPNPKQAHEHGLGMVYQHFTLVPNMTVLENFLLSRAHVPAVVDWAKARAELETFLAGMPFKVPLDAAVADLAAGEKQKAEILRQLYLKCRFIILDEPTSVLTPAEADEVLGTIKRMTRRGLLTVLMITHKFREVNAFADAVTVLRRGQLAGAGRVADLDNAAMAEMMIGRREVRQAVNRVAREAGTPVLEVEGLHAADDTGQAAVEGLDLTVRAGEIVGIAGVSGNGQRELIEVLGGQRHPGGGTIKVHGEPYGATRAEMLRHKVACLPEEPLRNACVGFMSVADNMAFRRFDQPPFARNGIWLRRAPMRTAARELIARYRVKTRSADSPVASLSGGNVQRAVLARELSGDVDLLIVANPCFGLDFGAVAEIRAQIVEARNRGVAVLLVSEDLDEILELADRICVMFEGRLMYETPSGAADVGAIGRAMAGH
ncbi:MAG: ABC transporter ATP-binding protein [Alphaproteobacteria bacterium]|nr:ABC transporter ATP-binding protein [Alphaproteobacteria bacterium]